jgi:D-aspartate ligase
LRAQEETPPAVIPALQRAGLALARGLGRTGIPVVGIGWSRDEPGSHSRYLSHHYRLDTVRGDGDTKLLELLRRTCREQRAVFLPDSDWSLEFAMRNWSEVRGLTELPLPQDLDTIAALKRKDRLSATAAAAGVATPTTISCTNLEELADRMTFPALVKAAEGKWFEAAFNQKAFLARNIEEALAGVARAQELGIETILQELVPDAQQRMYSLFSYISQGGAPLASIVGRKVRQLPVDFGSATAFRIEWNRDVYDLGMRLLNWCGYRGFAHVEFALDERDGRWKLIEVNPRIPQWVSIGIRKGFNIARIAYDDLVGAEPRGEQVLRDPVAWVDLRKDLLQAAQARDLRLLRFVAPYLSSRTAHAVFAHDDLGPLLSRTAGRMRLRSSYKDAGGAMSR